MLSKSQQTWCKYIIQSSSYQHDLGLYFIKVFGPVVLLTWLFACDFSTLDLSRMFPLQPEHSLNLADLIYKIYQVDHYINCISKRLTQSGLEAQLFYLFEKINEDNIYILRDGIVSPAHASLLKAGLCKPYNRYKPTQKCQTFVELPPHLVKLNIKLGPESSPTVTDFWNHRWTLESAVIPSY